MNIYNFKDIDKWIVGNSWINSEIVNLNEKLGIDIGSRWATSQNERNAAKYIHEFWKNEGLQTYHENFDIETYKFINSTLEVEGKQLDVKPYHRCPSVDLDSDMIDLGHGTYREVSEKSENIKDKIALIYRNHEPFTEQEPISNRVAFISNMGASAIIVGDPKSGRRMEYSSVWDTRDPESVYPPLPIVNTSSEHLLLLKRYAQKNHKAKLKVTTEFYNAETSNVVAEIPGGIKGEYIVMCGHHDTVFDTPGGNDNTSGAIAVIETARTVKKAIDEFKLKPIIGLRFITLSAEEQRLQGSFFHVNNNYDSKNKPKYVLNCDELSTGNLKGIVLGFSHLRNFLQGQLDTLNEDLKVHVMSQIDGHSDHFPFLEAGIDASHPWRWRFFGRYPSCEYHHEPPDTFDKLNVKDLKYYISTFSRLLIRLSLIPIEQWPKNPLTKEIVRTRLDEEKNFEIRTG